MSESSDHEEQVFGLAFFMILFMLFIYMMLGHYFEHKQANKNFIILDKVLT